MALTTTAKFLALVLTALALVPAGAHFFALPNKIGLPEAEYLAVQAIYRGWDLFGVVLVGALLANLFLALRLRRAGGADWYASGAFLLILATLAIFFVWVYPANEATADWQTAPERWRELRMHWEVGHAANAVLTFMAFCMVSLACIRAGPRREG